MKSRAVGRASGSRMSASPGPRRATLAVIALCAAGVLSLLTSPLALGAHRHARSRILSADVIYESLSYGPSANEVANVYPSATPNSPIVVLVHGGGWRKQGALGKFELPSKSLQAAGFTVVEINYDQDSRTVPAFPLEPNEVASAARWAISHAASFSGDPSELFLLGGSAGANLVDLVGEELNAAAPGTVRAVVSLSAPTNFVNLMPMLEENTITNEDFNLSVHRALGIGEEAPLPVSYAERWSPSLQVSAKTCPAFLIFNSAEELIPLSQAQDLYGKLSSARCNATLNVVPGTEHAFLYFHRVKSQVIAFLRAQ